MNAVTVASAVRAVRVVIAVESASVIPIRCVHVV